MVSSSADLTSTPFHTAPPEETIPAWRRWKQDAVLCASTAIMPLVKQTAGAYLGGETIDDAMLVADRLAGDGLATTLGYWDAGRDSARDVAVIYLQAIACLAAHGGESYLSLKPPVLRFSCDLARALSAAAGSLRLHCDSHGPEVADLSNAMLEAMAERLGYENLGTTLPGRWLRSLADADWAVARGLNVRVVKGQWPEPEHRTRDLAGGFLEVIDRLAGRARHVAVATHDFAVATQAIARLHAAGTSCEVEVLLGMPAKPLLAWSKANGIKTRIYVPYGAGFVPNAIGVLRRNPRLLVAVGKERLSAFAGFLGLWRE